MLRLAEKRAKMFRNVTGNFACQLLVSRMGQEMYYSSLKFELANGLGRVVDITVLSLKPCHKEYVCPNCLVNNVLMFVEWEKANIGIGKVYRPNLVVCTHCELQYFNILESSIYVE